MAKITKIQAQKKKGRVNIFLDDSFCLAVYDTALIDFNLYKGKELTDQEITTLKNQDDEAKCLAKAYHLLSFRPRSETELQKRLTEKYPAEMAIKVIKQLKGKGYIDDAAFVDFWIENRAGSRGPKLLTDELIKKGVERSLVLEKLSQINDESVYLNALNLVEGKSRFKNITKKDAYNKIGPYLARRGYSYEIIKKVIKKIY
ncbi:RecX family transcriptional regulator [Patescibacteria group bacterium]|nr:RecX family transcriptional regulator [Patescibacteria group bacterium]